MDIWNDRWHDGCIFHYHTIIKTSTFLQKSYSLFSGNLFLLTSGPRYLGHPGLRAMQKGVITLLKRGMSRKDPPAFVKFVCFFWKNPKVTG